MTILIGGDIVPTASNAHEFETSNARSLIGDELLNEISSASLSVFNLEAPLADFETPILKCGPNLRASTACAVGLRAINPGVFTLANNHIMDQGPSGLRSTLDALKAVGTPYFGVGSDITNARSPFTREVNGLKVGIYACVEHEFSTASDDVPGANPFEPLSVLWDVHDLKEECDYVIILYHGGKEHYRYPSPELQRRCRALVKAGADIVVCQHSHCVGCEERWLGGTIVYGQGNFLFDLSDDECWQTGLLVKINLGDRAEVSYVPIKKDGSHVRLAEGNDAYEVMDGFLSRSKEIMQPGFVEERYGQFAYESVDSYLNGFIPWAATLPFRVVNRFAGRKLVRKATDTKRLLAELNHIECEAHSELFITGLKALLREVDE